MSSALEPAKKLVALMQLEVGEDKRSLAHKHEASRLSI